MNTEYEDQLDPQNPQDPHDPWRELCALATTDALGSQEREQLAGHLAECQKCRELCGQYGALAHAGLPPLAGSYATTYSTASSTTRTPSSVDSLWDREAAKGRLLAKADRIAASTPAKSARKPSQRRTLIAAGSRRRIAIVVASSLAAAVVFALGVGGGYLLSKRAGTTPTIQAVAPTLAPVAAVDREKGAQMASLTLRLKQENTRLADLESEGAKREKEIADLKGQLSLKDDQVAEAGQEKATSAQALAATTGERDALQTKLHDAQANYDQVEQELTRLRVQRQQDQLHYASLEFEVTDLRQKLHDADTRASDATQYLASDRDIRELMGARQLYIADVTDMDANGQQRKPFGRVFYTKGKQLIFYAFDLNQQPGVKEASIFQAWAHEGSDRTHPVSLGIFYVDSEANRRWALKTDDPKVLAQINSVFVTVEPKGGSQKPTTKPLLYAYLKSEAPNHP